MQSLVVFIALFGCAVANLLGHAPAHIVPGPTILQKNVHHVEQVHPVTHVQKTVVPVHHPPVTSVGHVPDTVLAKAPHIHGYAYTSEVKHDAALHAAPVVAHAPVVAAAPLVGKVGYGAGLVGGYGLGAGIAGPVLGGAGLIGHGAPLVGKVGYGAGLVGGYGLGAGIAAPVLGGAGLIGHGAGLIGGYGGYGKSVAAGPIVKVGAVPVEQPAVSSYAIETGRTHVATQQHYGVGVSHGVVNVPAVKTVAQAVSHYPVAHAPVVVGHGIAAGHGLKY